SALIDKPYILSYDNTCAYKAYILWRRSSAGESVRFIPERSWVRSPPPLSTKISDMYMIIHIGYFLVYIRKDATCLANLCSAASNCFLRRPFAPDGCGKPNKHCTSGILPSSINCSITSETALPNGTNRKLSSISANSLGKMSNAYLRNKRERSTFGTCPL